jgi:hypothetical protein
VPQDDEEKKKRGKQSVSLAEPKPKHTLLEGTVRELVFQIRVRTQPLVQRADELSV